jgi:hypothetical protein
MDTLKTLIENGGIVDIVVLVLAVEIVVSAAVIRLKRLPVRIAGLVYNIGAGGSLALALGMSIKDAGWQAIAGFLVASFVFHSLDVITRWRMELETPSQVRDT